MNCTYTTAHSELRCISSIRQYLTTDATNVLFSAFLFSTLDYCQSLLSGAPQYLLDRLQRVQKAAARLAIKASKSDHILLLFCTHSTGCQWLLEYKIFSRCYSSLSDSGTKHLSRHLQINTPSTQLPLSSDNRILRVPSVKTKTSGQRFFSCAGPVVLNKVSYEIKTSQSKTSFKQFFKANI